MKQLLTSLLLLSAIAGYAQREYMDSATRHLGAALKNIQQWGTVTGSTLPYEFTGWIKTADTDQSQYDTLKIIAEVYTLPHKYAFGMSCEYDSGRHYLKCKDDSVWAQMDVRRGAWGKVDTTFVGTEKVLAWEVWRKDWRTVWVPDTYSNLPGAVWDERRLVPVELIKTLAYNKKDTLSHVLQTWRVEW